VFSSVRNEQTASHRRICAFLRRTVILTYKLQKSSFCWSHHAKSKSSTTSLTFSISSTRNSNSTLSTNQLSFSQTSKGIRTPPWSQTLRHAGQSAVDDHWQVADATLVEVVDRRQWLTMIWPIRKWRASPKR
jgi:hypothetical protein